MTIPKSKVAKRSPASRTITRTPAKIPKNKLTTNPFKTPPKPVEGKLGIDKINKLLGLKLVLGELRVQVEWKGRNKINPKSSLIIAEELEEKEPEMMIELYRKNAIANLK